MKQLSRSAFCLPLLMLTIEHTPEDSTNSQMNASATHQQWRLAISSSRADDDEDDVERIEIIGTQPPPFNPLPPGAGGGGGGGGAGGNWGGGGNETPPDPDNPEERPEEDDDEETEEICLELADQDRLYCRDQVFAFYGEAVSQTCPLFLDVQVGGGLVIFGSITVRSYDHCMNVANAEKDRFLNGCDIDRSHKRIACIEKYN